MRFAILILAVLGMACGPRPCSAEQTTCSCLARADSCRVVTDSCFCASECGAPVQCVCGGGKFVRCEDATDAGG